MNQLAIDDLLAGILARWCESAAEWEPPGQSSDLTCVTCRDSILAGAMDVAAWPHDLMHQLSSSLDAVALEIYDDLDARSIDGPADGSSYDQVRRYVAGTVILSRGDLIDVLVECVEPRIEAFTARQVETALARVGS